MYSKQIVSVVAALGMASGVAAVGCKDATVQIRSSADASQIAQCETVPGNVIISTTETLVNLGDGKLKSIGGDLICENNPALGGLSSDTLETVGGEFRLQNNTQLSNLAMTKLNSVKTLKLMSLNALTALDFGKEGLRDAEAVVIADTRLTSLEGINVQSVADMDINNNKFMSKFSSSISNLTNVLNINANGLKLNVELPNLKWIANATISNCTSFSSPSLAAVNGSLRFDSNFFESFQAPNLTEIQTGDLSFVSNPELQNISFPLLEKVGGGFTIANNTALGSLSSFPKLKMVGGAVALRGSFKSVDMPALSDVRGAFTLASTEDVQASCDKFQALGGSIAGKFKCDSKKADANENTSDAGSDGSSGSSSKDPKSGASSMSMSMSTVVSLAAVGAIVTAFL